DNLWLGSCVYGDVPAWYFDLHLGVWRDRLGLRVQVEGIVVASPSADFLDATPAVDLLSDEVHNDDDAHQTEDAYYKKYLASGDPATRFAFALRDRALVELHKAPNDKNKWPPVAQHIAEADMFVSPGQHQNAQTDKKQSTKKSAGTWLL